MKSKISFFNKTIFKKNLTLYWPVWVVYTLILTCMHPVLMWLNLYYSKFYNSYTASEKFGDLLNCLYTEPDTVLIALVSIILGMCLYGFLYNHKSANMIHSFPVDRNQLFGTNVISGMTFLIAPLFLVSILMTIIAVCNGVPEIKYIWFWFLLMAGTAFSAFSIVTFCAMFTGHNAALPVYTVILNYLPMWAYYIVYVIITTFGYGVDNIGLGIYYVIRYFSPLECFLNNVMISHKYDEFYNLIGAEVTGEWIVVIYVFVSIALLAIAYVTYKKRQVEKAGDFITVEWLKPVFRWGAGMTGGIFGALLIREILIATRVGCNTFGFVLLMLLLGACLYFVADMLIRKTFHVFKKKNWIGCGGFAVVMLLCFFGLYGASSYMESYVPETKDIDKAMISFSYDVLLEGEDAEAIVEIHKQLLEHAEYCEDYKASGNWEYEYVRISYTLKNGDYIERGYIIPYYYEEMIPVVKDALALEKDTDNFLTYLFCRDYDKVEDFGAGYFTASYADDHASEDDYGDYSYKSIDLTVEQIKALYEAVIADAEAGNIAKYNTIGSWFEEMVGYDETVQYASQEVWLELEYKNPNRGEDRYVDYYDEGLYIESEEYSDWIYSCVYIGPDCENVINKLIEFGIIESVDEVWWGDYK